MIGDIIKGLVGPITGLISEFVEDKDKANEIAYKIAELAEANSLAQLEVNKTEAAHKNIFVAGWRPALGWVCVLALGNNYLIVPYWADAVSLDTGEIMPLILGMLGLAGARTVEKIKEVARKH